MSKHLRHRLLTAALVLAGSLTGWCEDAGEPAAAFPKISSLFETPNPLGAKIFADYYGVFQGNPVGGLSQDFAYSQYLIFGVEAKEPLGWHGATLKFPLSPPQAVIFRRISAMLSPSRKPGPATPCFSTNASSRRKPSTTGWCWASGGWPRVNFSAPCRLSICS